MCEGGGLPQRREPKTVDLVRTIEDENHLFLSRRDRQIKTRGHRVELDEVEAVLGADPSVMEAAAFPVRDGHGSHVIEAAVILVPGSQVLPEELMEHLGRHLAPYALPVQIAVLGQLPRTATGKVDRALLRRKAEQKSVLTGSHSGKEKTLG